MAHSNASSRSFLRDARKEENVNIMRRIEDAGILIFGTPRMIMLLSLVWQISLPAW
jgi:hypothetical protein